MNTDENPALRPEYNKMKWQAVYYMISLLIFGLSRAYILFGSIVWSDTYIFVMLVPVCFTDIAPIAYVLHCHHTTFETMAAINIGM